jgi:hypothetical protein
VNNHLITYWWHDSLLLSQFVYIWEYLWKRCIVVGILLYSMDTVLSAEAAKLLGASSTITIRTSKLQWTIIILHSWVRVFYFPPILWRFEYISSVIWSILRYSMETVLSVEASKKLLASSTVSIRTSGLQGTHIMLHIGDMIAYYPPTLCTFENLGVF